MIKYFFKQYWRYIAMALAFASITFLTNACEVNAQSNTLYLNNVTANLYSNNNYVTGVYSSSNYDNVWTYSIGAKWGNNIRMVNQSNLNLGHGNVVLFNMRMHYTTEDNIVFTRINSVGFSDEACYYGVNNEQGANNSSKDTYITAICFVNQDLNFNSGDNVANVSFDWSNINYINVSNITIVDNEDTARSLKTLVESISGKLDVNNSRLLDINSNLTAINTILSREEILLAEISSYNNYIYIVIQRIETAIGQLVGKGNDIDASINNQTTTQHNDAVSQKESTDAINNSINDSDTSNVSLDTLTGQTIDTGVISGLMLIPINLVNSMIQAFNGTCHAYEIGDLLGTTLVLPCINLESFLGTPLWNTIDIMITGVFIFGMAKLFMRLFNKLMRLQDIWFGGVDFCD